MRHVIEGVLVSLFVFLISCNNSNDPVVMNYTAYSSNSKNIYLSNMDNYEWVLDKRWGMDKYAYDTISPSGEKLAFVRFPYITVVIKNSKGATIVDKEMQLGDSVDNLAWHPRETHLAFLSRRKDVKKEDSADVYIMNLQAKKLVCIYRDASWMNYVSAPSWSEKGDKLYFVGTEQRIIEYDMLSKTYKDIVNVKGREVHYLSDTELVIRDDGGKYYNYNLQTKALRYLFKLGQWEYPPIFLSPDKKVFLTWDTMPRRLEFGSQWYTLIREFPSARKLRTISNKGANCFSWARKDKEKEKMRGIPGTK